MTSKKKLFIILGILVVLLIAFAMYMNAKGNKLDSLTVTSGPYSQTILAVGKLRPAMETELKAEVTGTVIKSDFSEGAVVKASDILFYIENKEAGFTSSQLSGANPKLAQVLAEKRAAADLYNDSKALYKEGAISQNSLLDAESRYQIAVSLYDQVVADTARYQIKAGQDGVLIKKLVETGSYVSPGQTLGFTASLNDFHVVTELDERYFTYIKKGMTAEISIGEGAKYGGTVSAVSAKIDEATGTFGVKIALTENFPDKASDLTVNIAIILDSQASAISLPQAYLVKEADGSYFVWKYVDGSIVKTAVETGPSLTQTLLIKSGLAEGDILVSPSPELKDGDKVKI